MVSIDDLVIGFLFALVIVAFILYAMLCVWAIANDTLVGFKVPVAIRIAVWFIVTVLACTAFAACMNATQADHGSCKVGHHGVKGIFVCDEYYPLPETR